MYLGKGDVYFDSLLVGVNPPGNSPGTSTLKLSVGTVLTVSDGNNDAFAVDALLGRIVLDMADRNTQLRVYGDYRSSGPATNLPAFLADGRIVVTNDVHGLARLYYDAPYSIVGQRVFRGPLLIVK